MRVRVKILLILGLIIITLMAAFSAVSITLMLNGIDISEKQHAIKDAERFMNNFNSDVESLNHIVSDWASWDDTYNFVKDNNTNYMVSNIIDETFDNFQISVMLFFDEDNNLAFGSRYDLASQVPMPIDESTVEQIQRYPCLFSSSLPCHESGVIMIDDVPMLVAAHPILTSMQRGPPHGTMVIGRFLDAVEISHLSSSTGLPVTIICIDDAAVSSDFELAKNTLSVEKPFFTRPLNETIMASYVLLNGISGQPLLLAQIIDYRSEYVQGSLTLTYGGLSIVVIVAVMFLSIALLLDKLVVSRLSRIDDTVTRVRKSGDNSVRLKISGSDELSNLSANINSMLDVIDNNTMALENTVKERTKDLAANKKKLESILQASPDAIVAFDLTGVITECNTRVVELSGYDRNHLMGKSSMQFISEKSRFSVTEKITTLLTKNKVPSRFEAYFLKKDGTEIPVEISVNLLKDEHDKPVGAVGIIRDLSEKKLLEQQLVKSQRFAAIGELAGMVGHDIRNPLASIRNAGYILRKKCTQCTKTQPMVVPMLDIIDQSINHANNIVADLLEYSRELHLVIKNCSAVDLLDKAMLMVKVPDNVELVNSVTELALKVDEEKSVRVFINLIKNAFDAMPDGGKLSIVSTQNSGYTALLFSDTGKGIPPDVMAKLFTPLFTTKAQGMGFGLSISKRIVEAHGGKISVQSVPGKGTTFTVAFPN